ncbi:hypothetical protein DDB_G0277649 [Dictyostelium discoideum AX4]|uniref:Uncharacterized protein n=1 Tax=Dictyostelium discoideum TaxID=44689 RepID=Q54ZF1_DICDI|nr:hypothetical protein DDB_G0277649 [Dictyostelium discoideum AX4]EAL68642.1 hypothetical protein DDB_G0277649 [Dictyostelium discoideum AX4]|eukprot:XP_642546.1 hypothetical protein DDB_G0277649 [Dictyostelium discoideum AX4]
MTSSENLNEFISFEIGLNGSINLSEFQSILIVDSFVLSISDGGVGNNDSYGELN